jgi:hypothetical protein
LFGTKDQKIVQKNQGSITLLPSLTLTNIHFLNLIPSYKYQHKFQSLGERKRDQKTAAASPPKELHFSSLSKIPNHKIPPQTQNLNIRTPSPSTQEQESTIFRTRK